jgi:hypothetical protein
MLAGKGLVPLVPPQTGIHLFIYGLFNNTITNLGYIASYDDR